MKWVFFYRILLVKLDLLIHHFSKSKLFHNRSVRFSYTLYIMFKKFLPEMCFILTKSMISNYILFGFYKQSVQFYFTCYALMFLFSI